jgi:FkbM family methyltransferase
LKRAEYLLRFKGGSVVSVRPSTGDRFAVYEIFVRDDYAKALEAIPLGGTMVDVGANIGCFIVRAAGRAGAGGLIVAVEPEPGNCRQIQKNVHLNQLGNVEITACVLAGASGTRRFYEGSNSLFGTLYNQVNREVVGGKHKMIRAMTLEEVCTNHDCDYIDLLKLDCEGAEYEIIMTLPEKLFKIVRRMVIEIHQIHGQREKELVGHLSDRGFKPEFDGLHHFYI